MENQSNIPNNIKYPHKVPNKYFDEARQEILNKTVRNSASTQSPFKAWALAGLSLSFLFVIGFILLTNEPNKNIDLPNSIALEQSEYDLHHNLLANEMEADLLDAAADLNLDEELDELILSSIDGDYDDTDLYLNDFELELEYYENE